MSRQRPVRTSQQTPSAHSASRGTGPARDRRRETEARAVVAPPAQAAILALQRSMGNAAVNRLLGQHRAVDDRAPGEAGPDDGSARSHQLIASVLRTPGRPLGAALRSDMENRFDADFGDVRLHTDSQAQRSAVAIGATAYTSGTHIVARAPALDRPTLAHELTHVQQQRRGPVPGTDTGTGLSISDPGDGCERAATANAARVLSGPTPDRRPRDSTRESHADHANDHADDTALPAPGRETRVQRKIGFEAEISTVEAFHAPQRRGLLDKLRNKKEPVDYLKKKDVFYRGPGFTIEADEVNLHGHRADLEFVTEAFEVRRRALKPLVGTLEEITRLSSVLAGLGGEAVPASALGPGGVDNVMLRPQQGANLDCKPQATIGLSLGALDRLFSELAATGHPGNNAELKMHLTGSPDGLPDLTQARAAADQVVAAIAKRADGHFAASVSDDGVRGFLTQLMLYLQHGAAGVPGYGKTIAGAFLQRTDFATTFREMNPFMQHYLQQHRKTFVTLMCQHAGNLQPDENVFSGGLYRHGETPSDKYRAGVTLTSLTRRKWLYGILAGVDKLTAKAYPQADDPDVHAGNQEEIESLGGYGPGMDSIHASGGKPATSLPIVELRGMHQVSIFQFPALALDLFQYVYHLNVDSGFAANVGALYLDAGQLGALKRGELEELHAMAKKARTAIKSWSGSAG